MLPHVTHLVIIAMPSYVLSIPCGVCVHYIIVSHFVTCLHFLCCYMWLYVVLCFALSQVLGDLGPGHHHPLSITLGHRYAKCLHHTQDHDVPSQGQGHQRGEVDRHLHHIALDSGREMAISRRRKNPYIRGTYE